MRTAMCVMLVAMLILGAAVTHARTDPKVGVRAGVGTDIQLGLAYGGGANYLVPVADNSVELGVVVFGGSFDESTDEGSNTYDETTDVLVFGVMANYLLGYLPDEPSTFFVGGIGLASVSVEWEESSKTDVSLGTPLPGGGSKQSADGSAAGTVFNLGVGRSFNGGFEVRLEIPTILAFSAPGEATSVIPTVILTAGIRF